MRHPPQTGSSDGHPKPRGRRVSERPARELPFELTDPVPRAVDESAGAGTDKKPAEPGRDQPPPPPDPERLQREADRRKRETDEHGRKRVRRDQWGRKR